MVASWQNHYMPLLMPLSNFVAEDDNDCVKLIDEDEMAEWLLDIENPSGQQLRELKGIWYVNSIKEADLVTEALQRKNVRAASHHSKRTDNKEVRDALDEQLSIIVAVRTLREGYDNHKIDYVYFRGKQNAPAKVTDTVLQVLGRGLRKLPENEKISLFITSSRNTYMAMEHYRWQVDNEVDTGHDPERPFVVKIPACMVGFR